MRKRTSFAVFATKAESVGVRKPLFGFCMQAALEQLRMAEDKTGPLELLLVIFRALGAGKFETLYGLFGGGGGAGAHVYGSTFLIYVCYLSVHDMRIAGVKSDYTNGTMLYQRIMASAWVTPHQQSLRLGDTQELMRLCTK